MFPNDLRGISVKNLSQENTTRQSDWEKSERVKELLYMASVLNDQ